MAKVVIPKIGNVTIIQDGKYYGIKDNSNAIVVSAKYDLIEEWSIVANRKILKVVKDDLIGFYDSVKVEWINYCTLSRIVRYDKVRNVIIAKEPLKIFGIKLGNVCVEIDLNKN